MKSILPCLCAVLCVTHLLTAKDTPEAGYEKRLAAADLTKHPERHRDLATWCKRNFPGKANFHQQAFGEYQFAQLERSLPTQPVVSKYLEMAAKAEALGLEEKAKEYRGKWGVKQFAAFEAKMKANNDEQMKKLLTWAETERLGFIEPCQNLCRRILTVDSSWLPARRLLGEFQFEGEWMDFETALKRINIKVPAERMILYRALSAGTLPNNPRDFPTDPFRGWEQTGKYWAAETKAGAPFYVWQTGYDRTKPCALVIELHGGGGGGLAKAKEAAGSGISMWTDSKISGSFVVMAPLARKHVSDSWHQKDNWDDIMEALTEVRKRFNIDMTRLYVTGQSMGAGGTAAWMWYFPELAAAWCGRAGAYGTYENPKDLLKKPIMIIHGEKDEAFRNESRDEFIKRTEAIGGVVEHVSLPDQDHFIRAPSIMPKLIPFFEKHVSECPPDLRIINALAEKYLKK